MSESSFYITTPIYYVNDKPHIGHAYTTVLADVLARFHRLLGEPTYFLTGTDEHGQKVQKAADAAGMTAQEQADRTVVRFQEAWKRLDITHDDFIRTTEDRHTVVVQEILQDLYDRGEIYKDEYDGLYDVTSETFITDKDLPEGTTPDNLPPNITRIKETNYFFRMSAYQEWLIQYIHDHPEFIQPDFRRNETLGFLRKPLQDLCISRPKARLNWGIELPFDRDYVCYVWFDALVNYISGVGYRRDEAMFKRWWPVNAHLIGKDILTTHTVYWPTMLKAMGVEQPKTIFAHGWWLFGEAKMSKSVGNVVNPMDVIDAYGADAFRYFVMSEMTPGQDASFSEDSFMRRYNADLANDLGNLLSRVVNMIERFCGGVIPPAPAGLEEGTPEELLWKDVQAVVEGMPASLAAFRVDQILSRSLNAVKAVNRYLEIKQPWTLAKQEDPTELQTTLYVAAESLRVASGLLYPVMPERIPALRAALGLTTGEPTLTRLKEFGVLRPGQPVTKIASLFPRIERKDGGGKDPEPKPVVEKKAVAPKKDDAASLGEGLISIDDVFKVKLRTASVMSAETIPGSDKLLKLQIMMGEERRQLVAGIALHYKPEAVIGKTVIVVSNLKPAKIRGIESQGMLLAASKGEKLTLVTVDRDISSGAVVK
ncbi:MAG TPA: methionine--tRNA ligase [Kiritimatiellia bacterium]|nr:methionine--tRNA ligase [Kiritimatiellia bacterium]